jgi:hypothetical protein
MPKPLLDGMRGFHSPKLITANTSHINDTFYSQYVRVMFISWYIGLSSVIIRGGKGDQGSPWRTVVDEALQQMLLAVRFFDALRIDRYLSTSDRRDVYMVPLPEEVVEGRGQFISPARSRAHVSVRLQTRHYGS